VSTRNLAASAAPAVFPWRRVTLSILVAAGVVALASVAGPDWAVRVGAVVGVAAGVVAATLAVRSLRRTDAEHRRARGQEVLELERDHGARMREQRRRDREVADALVARLRQRDRANGVLRERLDHAGQVIDSQRRSLESLHAEGVSLRRQLTAKDGEIRGLRLTLATREEELAALLGDVDDAEVYAMPRRVRSAERAADPEPSELVDLATLQTATPPVPDLRQQA